MSDAAASSPTAPPTQRRSLPRVTLDLEVGIADYTNFYVGFSENISEGGLFLATYNLREVGTEIALKFTLPSGHTVEVQGVVRWICDTRDREGQEVPPGMGIQFQELADGDREAIRAFTEIKPPMFYPD